MKTARPATAAAREPGPKPAGGLWRILNAAQGQRRPVAMRGASDRDPIRHAIVSGVIGTCRALGCGIIAEGVERPGELNTLRDMGVRLFQGYLLARPAVDALPEPDFSHA